MDPKPLNTRSALPLVVSVNLVPRRPQAGNTVAVKIAPPGEEFVDREVVHPAGFLDGNSAAAHGGDENRLALNRPALVQTGKVGQRGKSKLSLMAGIRTAAF